jgi:hypothetical protein
VASSRVYKVLIEIPEAKRQLCRDERILKYILNIRVRVWIGFSRLRIWGSAWHVQIPLQLEGEDTMW